MKFRFEVRPVANQPIARFRLPWARQVRRPRCGAAKIYPKFRIRTVCRRHNLVLIFCLLTGFPLLAQQRPAAGSKTEEPMSSFQAVNASIDTILQQYEQLTGNVLIKDSNLAANALPISISVPEPVPRSELVRLIESALLLNNYALIPGPEPNTVKVININTGKNPRSEGVRLYASPAGLPEGEQIISYYMPFKYISANEGSLYFRPISCRGLTPPSCRLTALKPC